MNFLSLSVTKYIKTLKNYLSLKIKKPDQTPKGVPEMSPTRFVVLVVLTCVIAVFLILQINEVLDILYD